MTNRLGSGRRGRWVVIFGVNFTGPRILVVIDCDGSSTRDFVVTLWNQMISEHLRLRYGIGLLLSIEVGLRVMQ